MQTNFTWPINFWSTKVNISYGNSFKEGYALIPRKVIGIILFLVLFIAPFASNAQTFVHPGGLHTLADLDRMKAKVAAGEHPWIDSWNKLITDGQAQNTYAASPQANMGSSRQRADADAHAAYLNALRWYISGDTTYAACAVRICNAWSAVVNQVPTGTDIPGLSGIPVFDFALAAEVLRMYPGWAASDFARFKNMMLTYWYPVCHNFLVNHNGACISAYWSNWDIANTGALITMGVLCDDTAKYNEGVEYFKNGAGMGSIMNAVPYVHPGGLGQWQESGRDQEHAQLAVGMMASFCQVAWNQGLDLYGYDNNRLLAGAEYVARTNLSLPVPYQSYNNCDNANQRWVSINGIGRLDDRPLWELVYNHYAVLQGLNTPNVQAMAQVTRPEHGSTDHFGYGTLTFTLDASASSYPTSAPATPTGLTAAPGVSRVYLKWAVPNESTVQGYKIQRATTAGGPYTTIGSWADNTYPQYTDYNVTNGTTYYYVIAANNQSGTSGNAAEVSATPVATSTAMPAGWTRQDIGTVGLTGSASYANVSNNTFSISGAGSGIGGTADGFGYTYGIISGDATITARLTDMGGTFGKVGIMMRESTDPASKAFMMKRGDAGWRQAGMGTRSATGGSMSWVGGNDYTWTPAWFKLQRAGNVFTAFESSDGINWFTVGSATIDMAATYYIGLAAGSANTTALGTATFDNVTVISESATAPDAPAGLTAIAGNTQDTLTWNAVSGASSYALKRATVSGGPYTTIATSINVTNYIDTALVNGTTYYYVVSAANLAAESANSAEVSVTPVLAIPSAPAGVTAKSISVTQTNLSWTASLSAATYNVKRATASGGPYTTIGSPTTTSFSDATLTDTATYYYVVTAVNTKGESAASVAVSATPGKVSYWKFDETSGTTAADSWGNRNGALTAAASRATGIQNNGVRFDGTAGYVALPSGLMSSINDFTIATWVKADVNATWARVFDFGSGTTNYMFLAPSNGSNLVRYAITTGSGEQGINSSSPLSTGVWHHVAITQTGSLAILYIDGVEAGRNSGITLKPSSLGSTTQNWIGRSQWSSDPYLTGTLDEFRIYSRALSASELSALVYQSVPPPAPANLSIVGGNNQISLAWTAPASGATGYNVKRATNAAGPYSTIATVATTSYTDSTAANCNTYFYVVSAINSIGEGSNSAVASLSYGKKLTGTLIGTSGSFGNNAATTKAAAVDGNLATFFDAPSGTGWLGYDLGASGSSVVARVRYAPRSGFAPRMVGGLFQGSNVADFSTATTLFTVTAAPATGVYTEQTISNTTPFRYVRYISSSTGFGNVAEVEFYGLPAIAPQITGKAGTQTISYGAPFSYTILASNSPNGYSAVGLPDSLKLNTCTGAISGVAATAGTFSVILSATNAWGATTDTLLLNVSKLSQTITFGALDQKTIGDSDFDPAATASSGLQVTYSSSDVNVATVVNGLIHIVGAGTSTITASQVGNDVYSAAAPVSHDLVVVKKEQSITFNTLPEKKTGDADFDPAATASSGLQVTYSSSDVNVATIVNGLIHIVGAGTATITASQDGNNVYSAAAPVAQQLNVFMPPLVQAKNIQVALGQNGQVSITASQIDNGSVSYNGTLSLTIDKSAFDCTNVGTPVTVTLTGTDQKGYTGSATAQVTVLDTLKPVVTTPAAQFFCYSNTGSYTLPSLTASDNCGVASTAYSITGATTRSSTGANVSGVFNAGVSTITWTVTDVHGNVSGASITVTVNPSISVSIPNVYALSAGVNANTIYTGYGPSSLAIQAIAAGGTAPYTYSWNTSPVKTTQSISVTAAGTYTATVTDAKGCKTTASITIKVVDVRCGNKNKNIVVCHSNSSLCVPYGDVADHLNHGDKLGTCSATATSSAAQVLSLQPDISAASIVIYPNPVISSFKVSVSKVEPNASIELYNAYSAAVGSYRLTNLTQEISMKGMAAGIYFIKVKNGSSLLTQKIMKL